MQVLGVRLFVMRLCRVPCGKPPAFRVLGQETRGYASGGVAAKRVADLTESRRLSARKAAQPQTQLIADVEDSSAIES
jgi:hypothetical protein